MTLEGFYTVYSGTLELKTGKNGSDCKKSAYCKLALEIQNAAICLFLICQN